MPLPRDLSKEEKTRIFKDHSTKYLNSEEQKGVKMGLALFMKEKDPRALVNRLDPILNTEKKRNLFDTIGLFIPNKFFPEYQSLWQVDDGADAAAAAAEAAEAEAVAARQAAAAEAEAEASRRAAEEEAARQAAEAEAEASRRAEEEAARQTAEAEAAAAHQAAEEEAQRQAAEKEAQRQEAAAAEEEEAQRQALAAAAHAQKEAERKQKEEEDMAAEQRAAEAAALAETAEAAAPPAAAAEPEATAELLPVAEARPAAQAAASPMTQKRVSAEELERKRDEARAKRARERAEAAERKKQEEGEGAGLMRSRRSASIMGRKGGVAAMKARMAASASMPIAEDGEVKMRNKPLVRSNRSDSIVNQVRNSHLEKIEIANREGPVDRTELLVKAEKAAAKKYGGKIVIYTTSVTGIMETKIECKEMRGIFQRLRVRFEERNIYMDKSLGAELEFRLPGATLPQAFWNGEHLGDFAAILKMNETGQLQKLTKKMDKIEVNITGDCKLCGGEGFTLCTWCGGDKRKSMAISFDVPSRQTAFLKCTACNDNGLMMCPECMTRPEDVEA